MTRIILLFLSITLIVAGIIAISITEKLSLLAIALIFSGIICLILSLWLWGNKHKFWQKRTTKQSASALTTTILVLLVIGLINFFGIRYNLRWDFTENKIFTLSEQSQTIITQLKQPLEVFVFDRNINPKVEQLLQNYSRYSQQFKFKFINPEQEIGIAQQFGVQSLGEIYLQYGNKKQKLNVSNNTVGQPLTEIQLTNGIEKIKRDRPINIYFLQGHGEASLELVEGGVAQAVTNLKDKGNKVQELNLASTGKIPDNANLIIIAGATRKLLTAEVTSLQKYIDAGGNLLLLLAPNTDLGINTLLQTWGIELDNRLIVDGSGAGNIMGFGPGVAIVNNYGNHPITVSFRNGISIFPESRPLKTQNKQGIDSTPLAITNKQTWAESDLTSEEISFNPAQDLSGPLNIAIALNRSKPKSARIVVFGSSTFAANGWFEQQLNGDIFLNSVSWLIGEDQENLSIRPKEAANRRLNLSSMQGTIISWIMWIMPLIALITAGILWWQRR
jgi:ABC-type uncharacterized transport system involved in gliding motility auxiliary subunit